MSEKKRVLFLVLIMAVACMAVTGTTIAILYRAAFEEERDVLISIVKNHARLIEEFYRIEVQHHHQNADGLEMSTLRQLIDAHSKFKGIGHTGEFTLARRDGNLIVFLLTHRHENVHTPEPISMNSNLAEPMRRALLGYSGSMVGLDYRGAKVLAAYEPIEGLKWGAVAKVDLAELRVPFARAGVIVLGIAAIVVLIGAFLFLHITNPIITRIQAHSEYLMTLVDSLKQSEESLRKARDELEMRVEQRTAELRQANTKLAVEVEERTRAKERLEALWKIAGMVNAEDEELCGHILQGALQMTQSRYAFYGLLNSDESVMTIYSWSQEILEACRVSEQPLEFPVTGAGLWAEAIRRRQVVVVNDYSASRLGTRGTPEGHIKLSRIIAVPVFGHGRIVALVVAANKDSDYDDEDVKQLEAFASGVQMIIDQRKMEKDLRTSEISCRLLSRQVMEAQEKERMRVAREIHDSIGQSLAAIKYCAEGCLMTNGEASAEKTQSLRSLISMIRDSMEEVRRIQNDLRPADLDLVGVVESIEDFCARFRDIYTNIDIRAQLDILEKDVPEYLKPPIFRIVQEAMNNAAKHSGSGVITLSLRLLEDRIELAVEDAGSGFEARDGLSAKSSGQGMGLRSMKERAELSGGRLELRSVPGSGTLIKAQWPLETVTPR